MALDEPKDDDETFTVEAFSFCMNKELIPTVGDVTIDLTAMGFSVTSEIPLANSGSNCGGCSSTCGS